MIPTAKELHNKIASNKELADLIDRDRIRVENALSDAEISNEFSVSIINHIHIALVHELKELGYSVELLTPNYLGVPYTYISFSEPKTSIR